MVDKSSNGEQALGSLATDEGLELPSQAAHTEQADMKGICKQRFARSASALLSGYMYPAQSGAVGSVMHVLFPASAKSRVRKIVWPYLLSDIVCTPAENAE